jgi:hypothetical protein
LLLDVGFRLHRLKNARENTKDFCAGSLCRELPERFFEKGLWTKIGRLNIAYIIFFPERIEICPFFSVNRKERLSHAVFVN